MVDKSLILRKLAEMEDKVDEEIVVEILKRHLDDFIPFRDAVLAFLKQD